MPATDHVMIDIEAFGGFPGCAVASIAAVKFDPDFWSDEPENIGSEADVFYVNIDLDSSLEHGMKIEGDTIKWWFKQTDAARAALWDPKPINLKIALSQFSRWYHGATYTWAYPVTFDLPLVQAAYHAVTHIRPFIPWKWKHVKDAKTYFDATPGYYPWVPLRLGVEHHARDDARSQAKWVQRAKKLRREAKIPD